MEGKIIWSVVYGNDSYCDEVEVEHFYTEEECIKYYEKRKSKNTQKFHERQCNGYYIEMEKVTFGEKIVKERIKSFRYWYEDDSTLES